MTYFPTIQISGFSEGQTIDSFNRLRVSNPFTLFDSKQINGNVLENILFTTKSVNNASSSYFTNRASQIMTVAAVSGSRYLRQTRRYMDYQPGKGLTIMKTFILGTGSAGVVKRTGYFDDNNGIFLEQSGTNLNMVIRSFVSGVVSENRVSQSQWSNYKFDGSQGEAPLDPTKGQQFLIDFQWLGVGKVVTGFVQSGTFLPGNIFRHSNIASSVYMSSPNLPVREEIINYNSVSNNSMEVICSSVQSDAGFELTGFTRTVDRGVSAKSVLANQVKPLLTIKLTSGSQGAMVSPTDFTFFCTTADNYRWSVWLNPVLSGSDGPVWNTVSASIVQYDITRDATIVGGVQLDSGYSGNSTNVKVSVDINNALNYTLGYNADGVSDELVLAVQPLTNASFLCAFGWDES